MFLINSDREREMNLGREWKLGPLNEGEVYIHENMARLVGANKGDIMYLQFQIGEGFLGRNWLGAIFDKHNFTETQRKLTRATDFLGLYTNMAILAYLGREILFTQIVYLPMVIKDVFADINGKYDTDTTNGTQHNYFLIWTLN